MQSASPSGALQLRALPGRAWRRTREGVPAGASWTSLIVFLMVLTIAKSTVAASWVPGLLDPLPVVALAGAVMLGVLAVTPIPWWTSVLAGLAAGPVVAVMVALPVLRADAVSLSSTGGQSLLQVWLSKTQDGSAFEDRAFVLLLITWLMWVTGAWLSWCVLRWRQPMIGLVPGAAALATNVLNFPTDQNGYTLSFIVLTFALLLWTNYTGSIERANRAHVKLTGDARWDFWETGVVAMAGLLLLAIFLPPLSTEDRTLSMESSIFTSWAQLQDALNHQGPVGTGNGTGGGTTGFSTSAGLGGPLKTTKNVVFTYTVSNTYVGPAYFRGVNLTDTQSGIWFYPSTKGINTPMLKNQPVDYADTYSSKMATATFRITMLSPPRGAGDILFYPGQLVSVDRSTIATETYPAGPTGSDALATVDRLVTTNPPSSRGVYSVTVEYPDVGVSDLQSAGQDYPQWLAPYMTVDDSGRYRDPAVLKRIQTFTEGLVSKAGATNPYDKAVAIETFLRGVLFHYTLTPPVPTDLGTDPLDYFLFTSRQGYCQYFATAMADMLRSLGIPVRLVNGYGPGNAPLNSSGVWTVRDSDAHTWPEVFFPTYGWIPFEPTNDNLGTWNPIQHEVQNGPNICTADNHCPAGGATPSASPRPGGQRPGVDEPLGPAGGAAAGGFRLQMPDAGTLTRLIGILLAVVLLVVAVVARYLRPRTVMGVWNRTMVLARLAGSRLQPGETPFEWSRRVSGLFPDAGPPLRDLTRAFVVAAYGPPDVALSARSSVMDAWVSLRPLLLREVTTRLRRRRS